MEESNHSVERRQAVDPRRSVQAAPPETPQLAAYLNRLGEEAAGRRTAGEGLERRSQRVGRRPEDHPVGDIGSQSAIGSQSVGRQPDHNQPVESVAAEVHGGHHGLNRLSLGRWGYFLAAKLALFWLGLIAFHPWPNLGFVVWVLLPISSRLGRRIRSGLALPLAVSLLYYDSWLPPIERVLSRAASLSDFNLGYQLELLARFINPQVVAALLGVCAAYWLISRWLRAGFLVILAMLVASVLQLPWLQPAREVNVAGDATVEAAPDLDRVAQNFFDREAQRAVTFTRPMPGEVPFDLVFIHACSLSWDDVRAVGLEQHPLWQRFDILLTRFNAAASYSGPAAIHLLRANCGQQEHGKLYLPARTNCYLLDSLRASGFDTQFALNHKGEFDHFLAQMREHGRASMPLLSQDGLPVAQYAFNNDGRNRAPLYDDLSVLNRWISRRGQSERVALFYNTATLHDGNYDPGKEAVPNTLATYRQRLLKFLDEMDAFMRSLERSGHKTVVVLVPEHGGAVRGDARQIAGLREIPTPAIARVPVGIKVIGAERAGPTLMQDQPTSYLAISHIVERMLTRSPFDGAAFAPADYVAELPQTPFVAQNENITVLEYGRRFYIGRGQAQWDDYAEFNQTEAGAR